MSYTKRARELRNITVQDIQFRWRFFQKPRDSVLRIYGPISARRPLVVTLHGLQDSWTIWSPGKPERTQMGLKFVSQAVRFGLNNGWLPDQAGAPLRVDYDDGKFRVTQGNPA